MIKATQKIFEADSESLYDFVSKNGRGLYIPPYQREYAWTKDNVERLIADTVQGIAAFLKSPDESITFLGTIIAMNDAKKSTIDPVVKNQVYSQVMTIIDGQQRLTTLLMMCLVLLAEIKTQWSELRRNQAAREENTVGWLETRINDVLGLLSQMLSEEQRNGEGEFRYFPKMIRAFKDKWSYEADKATYSSPIAWVIFEYQKFNKTKDPQWNTFIDQLARSANARGAEPELANFVKLMKAMRSKLRALPNDEDFMDFLTIAHDVEKQEALFDEEFPAEMKAGLLLAAASGEAVEGAPEVDRRARKWWSNVNSLLALLFFSKFALERITLVVVTATTEDFAFDVFEALNTTGQPLTALETFTPKVVQTIGIQNYNASPEKKYMDAAFSYLKKISGNGDKQKSSSELIVAFALAERGEKQSKNLADQRRFMRLTFEAFKNRDEQKEFIRHLADLTKFLDETFVDQGAPVISGIQLPADVSLCIRFLVELGHTITAPLLAQYAAVITDDLDQEDRVAAIEQFGAVTKAVTAFAVFWRSSRMNTDRIDQVFRELMSKGSPAHGFCGLARGIRGDDKLPSVETIQLVLVEKLKADRASGGAMVANQQEWIEKATGLPIYDVNVALARFMLMVAFHDTVDGSGGDLVQGKVGTHATITLDAWTSSQYASVEHIAPQRDSHGTWDKSLYADDECDRLGNLTLVPVSANSSLGNRPWMHKRLLYSALASSTTEEARTILGELSVMGVEISVNAEEIHGNGYLPHLHAISKHTGEWSLDAVSRRGRILADLIWARLAPWLDWQ